ncbi:hypothetical protein [Polaromonas sp.]|uniref:hypothetical protein n=1 Tax=Polaromonas sp. TaxID=1869339 RepID=UPI003CB5F807
MQQSPVDLFGEVVVTQQDVRAWLLAVPRIDPDGPRAGHYVRGYGVVAKIAHAKLYGTFDQLTAPRLIEPQSAEWWHRMAWA